MGMNTDLLPWEGIVLCAVSGGADSMYLLCRLRELGYAVAAAHYNHGLRGAESDRDEEFVRSFCRTHDIPFQCGRGDVRAYAGENHLSEEEAARELRYLFLERARESVNAAVIATAHNGDDNAETMILNLLRGTGLRGVAGIPPVRGHIVRPMLEVTREEVEAYLAERNIPHVEDSTNGLDVYTRNRLRHEVMPVLKALNPSFVQTAGRTAALLRRDSDYLDRQAADFIKAHGAKNSLPVKELKALPEPVKSRVVRRMGGNRLSAVQTGSILALQPGGVADVAGMRVGRTRERLVFDVRAKKPLPERELREGEWIPVPEAGITVRLGRGERTESVHRPFTTFFFSCETIYGKITVGPRREGDRFRPAGRGCTKTLKQLFMELDIPVWERENIPVLRDERGILFVLGIGPDERINRIPCGDGAATIEIARLGSGKGGCSDA